MTEDVIETIEGPEATVLPLFGDDQPEEGKAPAYHTVLEVWREVLRPAAALSYEKVTPQYASKMLQSYAGLTFASTQELQDRYYQKIQQMADILDLEISGDKDCLSYSSPEEDVAENHTHYKSLLFKWQELLLQWELEWGCGDVDAAVELAAVSEIHKLFFSPTGLTAFLDNIRLELTEDDQEELAELLQEQRDAYTEGGRE
jgi:hypothetical protein